MVAALHALHYWRFLSLLMRLEQYPAASCLLISHSDSRAKSSNVNSHNYYTKCAHDRIT